MKTGMLLSPALGLIVTHLYRGRGGLGDVADLLRPISVTAGR